ncbi:MAG: hypothetical protein H0U95_02740 [Bacteroidetes bacterium]|nr:hypothetical protein [Bacteroidota bacterium]
MAIGRNGFFICNQFVLLIFTGEMMKALAVIFSLFSLLSFGQYDQMARNAFISSNIDPAFEYWNISKPTLTFHSSFKPYLSSTFANANDSAIPFKFYGFKNFFLSKTFNEKPEKRNWYNVQVHPILDAEVGYDGLAKRPLTDFVGGTHLKININNDFTFAGTIVGGKTFLPFYMDTILSNQKIIPSYGQAYGNNKTGYSFMDYTGYVSYSPNNNKIFNFQLGRDKHFIGDGYRSLLLSDNAPAYPFFRINTNIWRIQYNVWYAWMYDVTNANGFQKNFQNKFAAFHYLSYNVTKEFNVGLFENIVFRGTDSNQVRGFEVNYLNPIIFFRPQEFAVGSPDNAFIGLNLNYKLFNRLKLYGQLGLDEFYLKEIRARKGWWGNKQGWQLGAKYINAFDVKGLSLQAEYNQVRPYTYSHGVVEQNYAHYGVPLAHPFGANFKEYLGFLSYRKNNWELNFQGMYAIIGKDSLNGKSNLGQNIFLSYTTRPYEYGHKTTQGIKTNIIQSTLKFTYYLVPKMNMRIEVGYIQRSESNALGYILQSPFVYLGIKTSFWNRYRDL